MKPYTWKGFAPWFLSITSSLTLIVIGFFLVLNIEWYKNAVFDSSIQEVNTPEFRFYAYHLHLSMIKRSVGLFSGFAIMFLGMGVAFYTLRENTTIDGQAKGISMKLATASPGIIALLVGAYLISSSISSKDTFPPYGVELQQNEKPLDPSLKPELPN